MRETNTDARKAAKPIIYRARKHTHFSEPKGEWIESESIWEQPQRHGRHLHLYVQDGDEETEDTGWVWVDRNTLEFAQSRPATLEEVSDEAVKLLDGLVSDVGNLLLETDHEWQSAGYYMAAKEFLKSLPE